MTKKIDKSPWEKSQKELFCDMLDRMKVKYIIEKDEGDYTILINDGITFNAKGRYVQQAE